MTKGRETQFEYACGEIGIAPVDTNQTASSYIYSLYNNSLIAEPILTFEYNSMDTITYTFGGLPDDANTTVYTLGITENQPNVTQWILDVVDVGYGVDSIKNSTAALALIDFSFVNIMLPNSEFNILKDKFIEIGMVYDYTGNYIWSSNKSCDEFP